MEAQNLNTSCHRNDTNCIIHFLHLNPNNVVFFFLRKENGYLISSNLHDISIMHKYPLSHSPIDNLKVRRIYPMLFSDITRIQSLNTNNSNFKVTFAW